MPLRAVSAQVSRQPAANILAMRNRLKMIHVCAGWIPAQVIKLRTLRNRPGKDLVHQPVRIDLTAIDGHPAVAARLGTGPDDAALRLYLQPVKEPVTN